MKGDTGGKVNILECDSICHCKGEKSSYEQVSYSEWLPRKCLEGCLTVHLPHEIKWNANMMQLGNLIDVFLARHISGTYTHHQEH